MAKGTSVLEGSIKDFGIILCNSVFKMILTSLNTNPARLAEDVQEVFERLCVVRTVLLSDGHEGHRDSVMGADL